MPIASPIKAVIVTGHDYPGHKWRETTPAIEEALGVDPRMEVSVVSDPEWMAWPDFQRHDVMIFNYCNWERPEGISDEAKAGFVRFVQEGGGLVFVHFSNGAFHFSLPKAGESDWPEFRRLCRRVWNSQADCGHDRFGKFTIDIADPDHPITQGMQSFETIDELYFRQDGELPIHVLATAKSQITMQDEPMAFTYEYGKGRVFQTVLGHAEESLRTSGTRQLILRGTVWAARRE